MPHMRTSKTHSQLMRPPPVSRSAHRVQAWRIKSGAPLKELNGNQIHVQSQHRGTRNQSLVQKLLRSTDDTNSGERRTANPFPRSSADFRFFPIKLHHWIRRWKGDIKLRGTSNLMMKNSFVSSSQDSSARRESQDPPSPQSFHSSPPNCSSARLWGGVPAGDGMMTVQQGSILLKRSCDPSAGPLFSR